MPEYGKVAAGKFCWVELNTSDVEASKRFYGDLLGWSLADMPMPSGSYAMASVGGKSVAGMMAQAPDQKKQGVPPNWLSTSPSTTSRPPRARAPSWAARWWCRRWRWAPGSSRC